MKHLFDFEVPTTPAGATTQSNGTSTGSGDGSGTTSTSSPPQNLAATPPPSSLAQPTTLASGSTASTGFSLHMVTRRKTLTYTADTKFPTVLALRDVDVIVSVFEPWTESTDKPYDTDGDGYIDNGPSGTLDCKRHSKHHGEER
jgi:hypothetical protein